MVPGSIPGVRTFGIPPTTGQALQDRAAKSGPCVPLTQWLARWSSEPQVAGSSSTRDISHDDTHLLLFRVPQKINEDSSQTATPSSSRDLAQVVERSLSMREALGLMFRLSTFQPLIDCLETETTSAAK